MGREGTREFSRLTFGFPGFLLNFCFTSRVPVRAKHCGRIPRDASCATRAHCATSPNHVEGNSRSASARMRQGSRGESQEGARAHGTRGEEGRKHHLHPGTVSVPVFLPGGEP